MLSPWAIGFAGLGRGPECLIRVGTDITDVAVQPLGVVERVDPVGHRDYEFEGCGSYSRDEQFDLRASPEWLDRTVVETVAN